MNNYNYPTIQQNTDGNNILEENYIVFSLCNKKYAINIKNVIEVMNLPVIDIPESMPEGVTGIFNYKGLMIKAIDLCPMLGFEPRNFTVNNKLIIINLDGSFLAIHTDSIINIFSFEKTNIQPIPYSAENSILKNIYKNETEQICIVDIDNLNNLLALNTKKQNNIDYLKLFPEDEKSKQIMEQRSLQPVDGQSIYSFNFNLVTENQYILFSLNDDFFYIDLKFIKEFASARRYKITKLPYTPEYIKGIINLKGEFLVVLDLKLFLNLEVSGSSKNSKLIILERKDFNIALLVDDIKYIQNLPDIKPSVFNNISKYVYSEFIENEKLYTVLNTEKIINDERLFIDIN